jgi:carboxylesterase type B
MTQSIELPAGYLTKTTTYKIIHSVNLELDIVYPQETSVDPVPVLIHYHGGFLVRTRSSLEVWNQKTKKD